MIRRVAESKAVLDGIAQTTGATTERVQVVVGAIRDIVDTWLADDYSVIAPPLVAMWPGDPVATRFTDWAGDCTDAEYARYRDAKTNDEVAEILSLPASLVHARPIATDDDIVRDLLDRLGLIDEPADDTDDDTEALGAVEIYFAWLDTFKPHRPYRMSHLGLERHLERWLIDNLERLADHDYPVRLGAGTPDDPGGAQWVFPKQRQRPDLICRLTVDTSWASAGDWLVIELKATGAYMEAVDQTAGYVTTIRDELARDGQRVHGLMITDGAPHDVQEYATKRGIWYLPVTALGYRQALIETATVPSPRR